ncbi:hypothetical protein Ancab_022738 [Ancistrocladus abbreviatus]
MKTSRNQWHVSFRFTASALPLSSFLFPCLSISAIVYYCTVQIAITETVAQIEATDRICAIFLHFLHGHLALSSMVAGRVGSIEEITTKGCQLIQRQLANNFATRLAPSKADDQLCRVLQIEASQNKEKPEKSSSCQHAGDTVKRGEKERTDG